MQTYVQSRARSRTHASLCPLSSSLSLQRRLNQVAVNKLYRRLENDGVGVDMIGGVHVEGEFIRAVQLIVDGFDPKVVAALRYYGPKCTLVTGRFGWLVGRPSSRPPPHSALSTCVCAVLPSHATIGDRAYSKENKVVMALASLATYSLGYVLMEKKAADQATAESAAQAQAKADKKPACIVAGEARQSGEAVEAVKVDGAELVPSQVARAARLSILESLPESETDQTTVYLPTCPFASRNAAKWIG